MVRICLWHNSLWMKLSRQPSLTPWIVMFTKRFKWHDHPAPSVSWGPMRKLHLLGHLQSSQCICYPDGQLSFSFPTQKVVSHESQHSVSRISAIVRIEPFHSLPFFKIKYFPIPKTCWSRPSFRCLLAEQRLQATLASISHAVHFPVPKSRRYDLGYFQLSSNTLLINLSWELEEPSEQ